MIASQSGKVGVVILGRGRSGTSLTANLLSAAGAHANRSTSSDYRNPRGYWEGQEVVDLNRKLLAILGVTDFWVPKLDPKWPEASLLDRYRGEAKRVISELESYPIWVLKDPRLSITLPFWLPLFDRPIRFVVCIRNPLETAASYREFRRVHTEQELTTWYEFTMRALRGTAGRSRLIVHYHHFFDSQKSSQVAHLCEFAGLESSTDVESVVSSELYRNRIPLHGLLNDDLVPDDVKSLYVQLLNHREYRAGELEYGDVQSAGRTQNLTGPLRTLFYRFWGMGFILYREFSIHKRLPEPVRVALARSIGRLIA